jgi:DNA (cytosine-5)-methyltransferase 1
MRLLDTFSGIGGFSLGLERAGFKTIAFCEINPYAQKVLRKHWPEVPIYDDIEGLTAERLARDGITGIECITGGFPCQDISLLGKQEGIEGDRSGLWAQLCRLIGELQPRVAILENVTALLSGGNGNWFGRVLGDLAEIGYDCQWECIPASSVGAWHSRERIWIIAYPRCKGLEGSSEAGDDQSEGPQPRYEFASRCSRVQGAEWETDTGVLRVANGIPNRIHRITGLGNAIVPQIAQLIGEEIIEYERSQDGLL